ncbi:MAG TPA: helix-turn-helix domain-containing protein [Patescibacteria group bacterium]|nr:helix-turn-helix domain-containing protein [Patescibacteria group bacterium]
MNQETDLLTSLGLTATESAIYLAGLSRPSIDVQTLATQTRLKRPTIYHALETLIQKGLASKHGTARSLVFMMTSPERLRRVIDEDIDRLEERKQQIDHLLPILQAYLPNGDVNAIKVMQYDGISGIKTVVEEALYCRTRSWDILAPRKNFFSEFDKNYSKYYLETRRVRQIKTRSLWEYGTGEGERPLSDAEIAERNPRYLPKQMQGRFESVVILFDEKVAIISSLRAMSAILIDSPEIHRLMAAMFEGLWNVSMPYQTMKNQKKTA